MKTKLALRLLAVALPVVLSLLTTAPARAGTTIDTVHRYAWGANIGWINCVADTNNGAVIGEYVCSGYLYAANVGWINLGNGSPANGIYYQQSSAFDFGVNQDGLGNLRGYAWGANVGWINFEPTGAPKVDLLTGNLSGHAWSANCGWISLSNAVAYVQTDTIVRGTDSDLNGLPDAWERQHFGFIGVNPNADPDGDGMSNLQEYLAGTDPNDKDSNLRITSITHGTPHASYTVVLWTSVPSRFYVLQEKPSLTAGSWSDYINITQPGWNNVGFDDFNPTNEFFRVRAYRPLTP